MYQVRESARARRVSIVIRGDGSVSVTKPARVSSATVERFVSSKREWIETTLARFAKRRAKHGAVVRTPLPKLRRGTVAYRQAIREARTLIAERLAHFNRVYGYTIGKISIRNQKTRWGSCSREGNLNFNYRIIYLPDTHRDYIIVHELCHIAQHNHSKAFWDLVMRTVPDAKQIRKDLRMRYSL